MLLHKNGTLLEADKKTINWEDWQSQRPQLVSKNEKVVLTFPNDLDIRMIGDDLNHFDEIGLSFPAFKDGRAYSQARILREELGFTGILCASGDILLDQVFFMCRCGFDVFDIAEDSQIEEWRSALKGFSLTYQPTNDEMKTIWELRQQKIAKN